MAQSARTERGITCISFTARLRSSAEMWPSGLQNDIFFYPPWHIWSCKIKRGEKNVYGKFIHRLNPNLPDTSMRSWFPKSNACYLYANDMTVFYHLFITQEVGCKQQNVHSGPELTAVNVSISLSKSLNYTTETTQGFFLPQQTSAWFSSSKEWENTCILEWLQQDNFKIHLRISQADLVCRMI